jgi:multicomponent Na+:H+ antiporter subunit G
MTTLEIAALALIGSGALFFVAGTVGMLRFPDVFSRLHALTKADGLGLALTMAGAALLAESWGAVARLALIWVFVAVASATCGHLIAAYARGEAQADARGSRA